MATSKDDKSTNMAEENQSANVDLGSSTSNRAGSMGMQNLIAVTASKTNSSGLSDLSTTTTPGQKESLVASTAHNDPTYPAPQRPKPVHNVENAHLFNNAGLLIPSIPGIDSGTERAFDKGEIMSLGQARDSYYPNREPIGGSFLLECSSEDKQKRDDED